MDFPWTFVTSMYFWLTGLARTTGEGDKRAGVTQCKVTYRTDALHLSGPRSNLCLRSLENWYWERPFSACGLEKLLLARWQNWINQRSEGSLKQLCMFIWSAGFLSPSTPSTHLQWGKISLRHLSKTGISNRVDFNACLLQVTFE